MGHLIERKVVVRGCGQTQGIGEIRSVRNLQLNIKGERTRDHGAAKRKRGWSRHAGTLLLKGGKGEDSLLSASPASVESGRKGTLWRGNGGIQRGEKS